MVHSDVVLLLPIPFIWIAGDAALKETALEIIHQNFKAGWDATNESGGITYFLDAEGYTPQQLEHNMKLWWPLCEAMVAFSMAYEETLR